MRRHIAAVLANLPHPSDHTPPRTSHAPPTQRHAGPRRHRKPCKKEGREAVPGGDDDEEDRLGALRMQSSMLQPRDSLILSRERISRHRVSTASLLLLHVVIILH